MSDAQPSFWDHVGPFEAEVVFHMQAEPGWAWYRCGVCGEVQYRRRRKQQSRCAMTPACGGRMVVELECRCVACGGLVGTRRRSADARFCSEGCARGGGR